MKYLRTKNGIVTSNKATHELVEDICDAGYFRTLEKGASVRIGREWWNFYGSWVDIIDENGTHYSIRPDEVKNVTKELPHADTIEELSDCFVAVDKNGKLCEDPMIAKGHCFKSFCNYYKAKGIDVDCYLAILTDKGLIFVAKMNEEGNVCLL